jgi:hypothetical protein
MCAVPAGLAPYYEHICGELGWELQQGKLQEMQASNAKQLEELAAKIKVRGPFLQCVIWFI